MKEQPKQEVHHGHEVWVNPTIESLRRTECLCLNCDKLDPGEPDSCSIATAFYKICVKTDVALAVTRCPFFDLKQTRTPSAK